MPRTCQVHSPNGVCSISWVSNDPFLPLLVDNRRDAAADSFLSLCLGSEREQRRDGGNATTRSPWP
jgi:hypothetical protein